MQWHKCFDGGVCLSGSRISLNCIVCSIFEYGFPLRKGIMAVEADNL